MLAEARFVRSLWNLYRRFVRYIENEGVYLYFNGLLRFLASTYLTIYFYFSWKSGMQLHWTEVIVLSVVFFAYNCIVGFWGLENRQLFLKKWTKLGQAFFEIAVYTTFFYLSGNPHSDIFILYLIPLFASARFLPRLWTTFNLGLAISGFFIISTRNPSMMIDPVFVSLVFYKALFLAGVTFAFILQNRMPLVEEVQEGNQMTDALQSFETGVFIVDLAGRILFANQALIDRHGEPRTGESCSRYFKGWLVWNDDPRRGIRSGDGQLEVRLADKDGKRYLAKVVHKPIKEASGQETGKIVSVSDIDRLQDLQEQVTSLNRMKAKWLNAIKELGAQLKQIDDPHQLMKSTVDQVCKELSAETAALFLVDRDNVLYRRAIAGAEQDWLPGEHYAAGEGLTGQVLLPGSCPPYGDPIRSDNIDKDPRVPKKHLDAYRQKLKSGKVKHLLAIPLDGAERTFGVLRVVNKLEPDGHLAEDGFSEKDEELLLSIAQIVAVALENAHSYQEISHLDQVIHTLYTCVDDPDQLRQTLVNEAKQALPAAEQVYVYEVAEGRDDLSLKAFSDPPALVGEFKPRISDYISGNAVTLRKTVYDRNTQDVVGYRGVGSVLVAPLVDGNRVIEIIIAAGCHPGAFTQEDQRTLESFAGIAVMVMSIAKLIERQSQYLQQLKGLEQVTLTIASKEHEKDFYQGLLEQIKRVIDYDCISIQLKDKDLLKIVACTGFHDNKEILNKQFHVDDPKHPNHLVMKEGKGKICNRVRIEYPVFLEQSDIYESSEIQSWMGIPMWAGNRIIGMIAFDSFQEGFFTEEMKQLAQTLAAHIAAAILNLREYQEEKSEGELLKRYVDKIGELDSITEHQNILTECARLGGQIFDVEDCSIYLVDRRRQTVELVASSCIPPEVWTRKVSRLNKPGLTAWCVNSARTLNYAGEEYKDDGHWAGNHGEPFLEHLRYLETHECTSLLMCPIKDQASKGQSREVIGVLKLENRRGEMQGQRFSQFEEAMGARFSEQIQNVIRRKGRDEIRDIMRDDLHDIAALMHGAVNLRIEKYRSRLVRGERIDLRDSVLELDRIQRAAKFTYNQIAAMHKDLYYRINIEEIGLQGALEQLCDHQSININLAMNTSPRKRLPVPIEYALYKIGSQAISNIKYHSLNTNELGGSDTVNGWISLNVSKRRFMFVVEDHGPGFDVEKVCKDPNSYGLASMEHWARNILSEFNIFSQPGHGTRIVVKGKY